MSYLDVCMGPGPESWLGQFLFKTLRLVLVITFSGSSLVITFSGTGWAWALLFTTHTRAGSDSFLLGRDEPSQARTRLHSTWARVKIFRPGTDLATKKTIGLTHTKINKNWPGPTVFAKNAHIAIVLQLKFILKNSTYISRPEKLRCRKTCEKEPI